MQRRSEQPQGVKPISADRDEVWLLPYHCNSLVVYCGWLSQPFLLLRGACVLCDGLPTSGDFRSGVSRLRRWAYTGLSHVSGLWTPSASVSRLHPSSNMPTTPSRNTRRLQVGLATTSLAKRNQIERAGSWKPRLHTVQGRTSSAMLLHRHAARRSQRNQQSCRPRANVGLSGGRSCVCSGGAGRVQCPHLLMPTRPTPNLHIPRALPTDSLPLARRSAASRQPTTALFRMRHARLSTSPKRCMQLSAAHPHPHQIAPAVTLQL